MAVSVSVAFVMLPARPETAMFDGYGLAAVGGAIPSTIVIGAGFEKTTCGAAGPVTTAGLRPTSPFRMPPAPVFWRTSCASRLGGRHRNEQSSNAVSSTRLVRKGVLIIFSLRHLRPGPTEPVKLMLSPREEMVLHWCRKPLRGRFNVLDV